MARKKQKLILPAVEQCIAWAQQHGYVFAVKAAAEYGSLVDRQMIPDELYSYYNLWKWKDIEDNVVVSFPQLKPRLKPKKID